MLSPTFSAKAQEKLLPLPTQSVHAVSDISEAAVPSTVSSAVKSESGKKDTKQSGSNQDSNDPKDVYRKSLTELSNLYQKELEQVTERQKQSQQLFKDGLISRIDMETGDKAVTDAQAKLDNVRKQLTDLDKLPAQLADSLKSGTVSSNVWWSTGNLQTDNLIKLYSGLFGVDSYLVYCLINQESRFSLTALSPKGAQGIMQLMPGTAARYGVTNPYDVGQNIKAGTHYLKDLLTMFSGRIDLALAGYNAGENAVIKYGYQIPPYAETQSYVRLISKRYLQKPAASAPIKG